MKSSTKSRKARPVEMHIEPASRGRARLEIVTEDDRGERFVVDLVGPADEIRAEADFLAEQYHVAATA